MGPLRLISQEWTDMSSQSVPRVDTTLAHCRQVDAVTAGTSAMWQEPATEFRDFAPRRDWLPVPRSDGKRNSQPHSALFPVQRSAWEAFLWALRSCSGTCPRNQKSTGKFIFDTGSAYKPSEFHARFLSHFILFLYFCTVVLQQFHATMPL